jgi:threonine dehydrogenase-like Zn-dependent dehydrogenase
MRALYLDRGGPVLRRDYPDPVPAPGEIRVRMTLAGICGTDLELIRGYMGYRGVPGHEFVGIVDGGDNPALRGQRVVGEINAACGHCSSCQTGMERHCPNRTVLGILGRDGAFAEYLTLPDRNLIPLPPSISDEVAVMVEPVAAACEIFKQTALGNDEKLLVLGDGRLGAIVAGVLRAYGYNPLVGGHHRDKLARLAAMGFATAATAALDPGFDTVIDCTGHPSGFPQALGLVRPRGRIILKSTAAADAPLNLAPVVINEITVIGSRCGRFAPAIKLLAEARFDPRPLISARYSLDDALDALDAAADRRNFKILLQVP